MSARYATIMAASLALLLALGAQANAEVKKFLEMCDGKLCPYFELVLKAPDGWSEDKAASKRNRVQVLLPNSKTFGNAEALIYVKVTAKDKAQPLADFIKVSQDRWRKSLPDTKISKLANVQRANGKPAFETYTYENPSQPQQGFEIAAFGVDSDVEGNDYVLQVVITGPSKKAIAATEKPFQTFLRTH